MRFCPELTQRIKSGCGSLKIEKDGIGRLHPFTKTNQTN